MIYFCKGCDNGCKACTEGCDEVCSPCCKVLERPLGGYVLLCGIVNFIVFGCAGAGMVNEDVSNCPDDYPVMLLCICNVVLAVCHAGFAVYLQSRIVSGLQKAGPSASGTSKE